MIGTTVGHYRITARLGAGGMREVFLAEDTRLDRKAAIKFLPADLAHDPERRQRFLTEAKAASALNHPHVCVVYDVGETDDGLPFIAMEFVEGQSLAALVKQGPIGISSSFSGSPLWHRGRASARSRTGPCTCPRPPGCGRGHHVGRGPRRQGDGHQFLAHIKAWLVAPHIAFAG
jgi:hypothetical protein